MLNTRTIKIILCVMVIALMTTMSYTGDNTRKSSEEAAEPELNLGSMLQPVPPEGKLFDEDYYIWGASMIRDDDGTYHLFYSRWPKKYAHRGWLTHAEIAHAVSDKPGGPYKHVDVPFPARGRAYWDGLMTCAANVHKFGDKYYIYYLGTTGDGKPNKNKANWLHRNNQRVGVAVADSLNGPWKRFDKPIIDVGGKGSWDELLTSTPAVCRRPDGKILLIYKCAAASYPLPYGGPVVHMAAVSDNPLGPFAKHPTPVLTDKGVTLEKSKKKLDVGGKNFSLEDPYIWCHDGRFWAVVKDFQGYYTKRGRSLALFTSDDGFDWRPAKQVFICKVEINWKEQKTQPVDRLERPQLYIEDGVPKVLFLSVAERNHRKNNYNIHIPLEPAKSSDAETKE